jgi:predicted transcriptional regulator
MVDDELIKNLIKVKRENNYTLYDLSKKLGLQISTIERWIRTKRINRVYAHLVKEKLNI